MSDVEALAVSMAIFSRIVDQARTLRDNAHRGKSPALASAYKQYAGTVDSVASRPWQEREMSKEEEAGLDKVELAYFVDVARGVQTAGRSTGQPAKFLQEYNQRSTVIGTLADKDWQKGQLEVEEYIALCKVAESIGSR